MRHIHTFESFLNSDTSRNLIREGYLSTEITVEELRTDPRESHNDTVVKLILTRKVESNTAVYRLETDNWFRRYEGIGKGYGLMIRKFELGKTPIRPTNSWVIGPNQTVFNAFVTYLPWEFDDTRDDLPENWETAKGYLVLGNKNLTGFDLLQVGPSTKDFEEFVRRHVRSYVP